MMLRKIIRPCINASSSYISLYPVVVHSNYVRLGLKTAQKFKTFSSDARLLDPDGSFSHSAETDSAILNYRQNASMSSELSRQIWIESLNPSVDGEKVGLITLHPDIFGIIPRLDVIHDNVVWQRKYKDINYANTQIVNEVRGGTRKPWPQKGTGRARHGSIRAPQWKGGGIVHGPRRYTTHFYMLPFATRVRGLISTLSCKFAQDDLKVVSSLEIPLAEPEYIQQICEDNYWGTSVLFVDEQDIMPENITLATENILHYNLLPVYGLNVFSMLKHDTLVLTVAALNKIQERLLFQLYRSDRRIVMQKYVHSHKPQESPLGY